MLVIRYWHFTCIFNEHDCYMYVGYIIRECFDDMHVTVMVHACYSNGDMYVTVMVYACYSNGDMHVTVMVHVCYSNGACMLQ